MYRENVHWSALGELEPTLACAPRLFRLSLRSVDWIGAASSTEAHTQHTQQGLGPVAGRAGPGPVASVLAGAATGFAAGYAKVLLESRCALGVAGLAVCAYWLAKHKWSTMQEHIIAECRLGMMRFRGTFSEVQEMQLQVVFGQAAAVHALP
eukprot:g76723.t1